MHDRRNFLLVLLLIGAAVWALLSWAWMGTTLSDATAGVWIQRGVSLAAVLLLAAWLAYAFFAEDKLPDHLRGVVGDLYYEVDGLSFMPMVRRRDGKAELCIYYQNRFENPANAVVHMRPPQDSFVIRPGMRDAHFAFRVSGGDFGCLRQPIAVPSFLQGEVVEVELAAACHYPRGRGARLRRKPGLPCGALNVDWHGAAFKSGVHEVSGEIELEHPTRLHLSMPRAVKSRLDDTASWRQEQLAAGAA